MDARAGAPSDERAGPGFDARAGAPSDERAGAGLDARAGAPSDARAGARFDARTVARAHALGRVAVGAAMTFAPGRVAGAWIGPLGRRPGARVVTSALGARDLAIGLGAVAALAQGTGARPWVRAGVLADAADLVVTVRAASSLPLLGVAGATVMAAGSTLLGLWLQRAVD